MALSPYIFITSIGPVDMNKYARFDEIPSIALKDIKETKCYRRTDVKTVYPPTNTVCGRYNNEKNEKKGYSYNLMLKNTPYNIMAELKSIPIMPAHPRTHLYRIK